MNNYYNKDLNNSILYKAQIKTFKVNIILYYEYYLRPTG